MMEIAVALVIIAIMVAVIVPSLTTRLDQAKITTLQTTLDNVLTAIRNYKTNVTRYPQRLQQLSFAPNSFAPNDLCGTSIVTSSTLYTKWRGPYISLQIDPTTASHTASGLSIGDYVANDLLVRSPTTSTTPGRIDVVVPGLIQSDWQSLNDAVDGVSGNVPPLAANGDDTSGTVHWSSTATTLYYGMAIAGC
jgi:type II secretory pathway pseudopilin PulG